MASSRNPFSFIESLIFVHSAPHFFHSNPHFSVICVWVLRTQVIVSNQNLHVTNEITTKMEKTHDSKVLYFSLPTLSTFFLTLHCSSFYRFHPPTAPWQLAPLAPPPVPPLAQNLLCPTTLQYRVHSSLGDSTPMILFPGSFLPITTNRLNWKQMK